jgi:hypothetical protein
MSMKPRHLILGRSLAAAAFAALAWLLLAGRALAADPVTVDYLVEFRPAEGTAAVTISLAPGDGGGRVIELDFAMDPRRYSEITGDGALEVEDGRAVWEPPREGGSLQFKYRINKQRRSGGYDARITDSWVIVRGDHLVPAARTRFSPGARTEARLRFVLPEGWTAVETPYVRDPDAAVIEIENPERRFVRPVGWMIAGDLGIRREWLAGMEMAVAAPRGEAMRRNDILAFTNMLAAELKATFGALPPKLLVVGAGDPMWRGGLSGPNSMYLHAERPLVSENGTSTLVHELVHVITRIAGRGNDRWIGEGIAEYYAIELMRRAGLITERRAELAFEWKEHRGRRIKTLSAPRSSGPRTDRAVTLFAELNREIREVSGDELDLDDLVQRLMRIRRLDRYQLRKEFEQLVGQPSQVLRDAPLD